MLSKKLKYFLTLILLVVSEASFAVYGCYLPGRGNVYTEINNNNKYKKASDVFVGGGACLSGSDDGGCVVNYSPNETGVLGDYDVSNCPLDDYVWILIMLTGVLIYTKRTVIIRSI